MRRRWRLSSMEGRDNYSVSVAYHGFIGCSASVHAVYTHGGHYSQKYRNRVINFMRHITQKSDFILMR